MFSLKNLARKGLTVKFLPLFSSLLLRFTDDTFDPEQPSTIGRLSIVGLRILLKFLLSFPEGLNNDKSSLVRIMPLLY